MTTSSLNTSCTTDLVGAWIVATESHSKRLVLHLEGVRHLGGVFAAKVTFDAATLVKAFDPRNPAKPPALAARQYVLSQVSQPGQTTLHMERVLGPGEVDKYHFVIAHGRVNCELQFKAGQTLRSWVGFFPLARDLRR